MYMYVPVNVLCICMLVIYVICNSSFCSQLKDSFFCSLGETHIGYKRRDFPELKLSIVGGRPLSSGGDTFGSSTDIVSKRFALFDICNKLKYQKEVIRKRKDNVIATQLQFFLER